MTMPRPSLVTSSGPSPVLGFMAAMRHPLPRVALTRAPRGHAAYPVTIIAPELGRTK